MKVRIVAVGGLKQRAARELTDEYLGRIRRYCTCEEVELKPGRGEEAGFRKATKDATVVALDVKGDTLSSEKLARRFEQFASRGKGIVAFLIGVADGLPPTILREAHACWSMSALTLPHRIARVVLAEQIYRALTILRNEPYNH